VLSKAVRATFARRETPIPDITPDALSSDFANDPSKKIQWEAFVRKAQLEAQDLPITIAELSDFLLPVIRGSVNDRTWNRQTGWISKNE